MWRWIYLLLFTGWLRNVAEPSYLLDTTAYKTRTFRNELVLGSSGTTTCTLSAIRFLPQTDGALRYLRLGVGAYQQIQQSTWNIQLWNDADGYVGTNIMTIGYSTSSPTGFQEIALDIGANGPALSAASTYWLTFSARVAQAAATGMAWFHNTTLADNLDTTEFYSYM